MEQELEDARVREPARNMFGGWASYRRRLVERSSSTRESRAEAQGWEKLNVALQWYVQQSGLARGTE